jgi:hypothetical protein
VRYSGSYYAATRSLEKKQKGEIEWWLSGAHLCVAGGSEANFGGSICTAFDPWQARCAATHYFASALLHGLPAVVLQEPEHLSVRSINRFFSNSSRAGKVQAGTYVWALLLQYVTDYSVLPFSAQHVGVHQAHVHKVWTASSSSSLLTSAPHAVASHLQELDVQ